ncbi:ABC transporter permease [Thalassiella azotivora]
MLVALADLRHARGRFALVTAVVAMVALLVTALSALTAGLARESASAVSDLPADHLAFGMPGPGDAVDLTSSRVTPEQWSGWGRVAGVRAAEPLGVAPTRATSRTTTASVTALGVRPGSGLVPGGAPSDGEVVLSRPAAEQLDLQAGDVVSLDGTDLAVARVAAAEQHLSHTPVVWTSLRDWQAVGARGVSADEPVATVVALTADASADLDAADLGRADEALGTTTVSRADARGAIASYAAESLSLTTIQVFLVVISALVVGAFFTVWTIGRQGDVAVLKALGASTGYLLRDAVGQAAVLLVGGVAVGTAAAAGLGALAAGAVPVLVSPATTLGPAAVLVVLGLGGATTAVARITRIDPHAALAAR